MSDAAPGRQPLLERLTNLPLSWQVAGATGLLGLLLLVGLLLTPSPPPPTATRDRGPTTRPVVTPQVIVEPLTKANDLQTCRAVLQQLNAHQAGAAAPAWPPADLSFLRQELQLDDGELAELTSPTFTPLDAHYLASCYLLADAARSLRLAGQSAHERAQQAFAWVVRQVRLEETAEELYPSHAILRRGWGTDQQRTILFLALLEQLELSGAVVRLGSEDWLVGALVEGDLLLFEPRLGVPLPGPGLQGTTTLSQLRKQPTEVLRPLAPTGYSVPPDLLAREEVSLAWTGSLSALAPRLGKLEKLLGPHSPVRLTISAAQRPQQLRQATARGELRELPVRCWSQPVRALRSFLPAEDGGSDRSRVRLARFNGLLIPWQALPEVVDRIPNTAELGHRLRNVYATPFLDFALKGTSPRELLLRGRQEEAVGQLVELLETAQRTQGATSRDVSAFHDWCQEAGEAQAEVDSARRQADLHKTADHQAAVQRAEITLQEIWKRGQPALAHLAECAAIALAPQVSWNLALAKQEQAELLQRQGKQANPDALRRAWEAVRDRWQRYLADYPDAQANSTARLHLARALEMLGDRAATRSILQSLADPPTTWTQRTAALRALQLK